MSKVSINSLFERVKNNLDQNIRDKSTFYSVYASVNLMMYLREEYVRKLALVK
eukprot:UN12006